MDCEWGEFGDWSECTKTCGAGTQTRTRAKIQEAEHGGTECEGSSSEQRACEVHVCPGNIKMLYTLNKYIYKLKYIENNVTPSETHVLCYSGRKLGCVGRLGLLLCHLRRGIENEEPRVR